MTRIKGMAARIAIFAFSAAAAFYALYVSSRGRLFLALDDPDALTRFFSGLAASLGMKGIADMLTRLRAGDFLLAFLLFTAVCFGGEICFQGRSRAALRRQTVRLITPALIAFAVIWVLLRLNHTSLFAWNRYLRGNEGYPLFGMARQIRRDEFSAWTPMALSQEALGWPAVNTLIGNGTDVTWVSMGGLPAWNAALIFKPLYWGFLLLGSERGLSFLCVSRLVLLFAVSERTARLYTRNNRGMSITAGVILTLSPMIQWFISQSIAEILIFGQGMVLAMNGLVRSRKTGRRMLYALLNGWLLGCLILVGYPAWIIPAVYLVLAAGILLFIRSGAENRGRKLGSLILGLLPSLAMLGLVVYGSRDTLQAIRNSVYPGHRLITGGLSDSIEITGQVWNQAFKVDLASIFFPLENMEFSISNPCDASAFLGFAPAGVVLSVEHQWRERKADPLAITVMGVMAVFWLFTFVELPAWLCRITLLAQCSRPIFPISICEVILLIRARARGGIRDPRLAGAAALLSAGINLAGIVYYDIVEPGKGQLLILSVLYLFLFTAIYFDWGRSGARLAAYFLCCTALLAGGFVNPVQRGLGMLEDFELIAALKSIENEPEDLYALEGNYPLTQVPLLAGKHCINTDQPYADLERWLPIDPELEHREIYNRLCHVNIWLAEPGEGTAFEEGGNDITLRLTREDLAKLGVNYLITPRENMENAEQVANVEKDGLYVWRLE